MSCPKDKNRQSGQALVVILLVSAIGLTIGLTLASRSTEETSITTELEESSRAFSAAEAGLEESVQNIGVGTTTIIGSLGTGAAYDVQVEVAAGEAGPFQFPGEIKNNQPVTVWLTGHDAATGLVDTGIQYGKSEIDICWGEVGGGYDAALEMTLYYQKGSTYYLARKAYNSTIISNAEDVSPGNCGEDYQYKTTVDFGTMETKTGNEYVVGDTLLYLKIRPVFADPAGETRIAVDPGSTELPTQGEIHTSTGTTSGGRKTKIVQFISHPGPPELFDTVIYSDKWLTK